DPQHDVDPGGVFPLGPEGGVGAVLAAAVAHAAVDHDNLAVIPEVDAGKEDMCRQPAHLEGDRCPHAGGGKVLPALRPGERARADTVDQHPAGHAAGRCALHGVDDAAAA